jgi:hypothetical protein
MRNSSNWHGYGVVNDGPQVAARELFIEIVWQKEGRIY